MVLLLIHIYVMMTATFILMFFLFPADLLFGQNIAVNEVDIVGEIERRVTKLAEETLDTRRKNNKKRLEKILLRISSTGMLALSRNEIFAESLSIFQNDDVEEETGERSQFVPTVGLDESLFTVPSYYLVQVIGRALAGAGIVGSDVIQLKPLSVSCHTEDWSNVYQDYLATYHPAVASFASPGSLKYRLSQFLRRAKTELSCLGEDEELASLLEALQLILSEDITNTARGLLDVRSSEMEEAILDSYEAVESVIREREKDWRTILSLRLVLLLSKMVGWGLQTWGRNLDDWPADVGLLDVPTNYYVGIAGRALLYSMFVLDDFRNLLSYSSPTCGSSDLYSVLSRPEFSPLLSGDSGALGELQRKLTMVRFTREIKKSVSCLTSVPTQFYDLDIIGSRKAVKLLHDRIDDLIQTVSNSST